MNAESGGRKDERPQGVKWLLSSPGLRVEGPAGLVGHVVAPVYDHSARWDCPRALAVRGRGGVVEVALGLIERIEPHAGRIVIRRDPW